MADLRTNIGTLPLQNPVMTASGTFGYGLEFADLVDLNTLGGIIVKGTTPRQPRPTHCRDTTGRAQLRGPTEQRR